MQNDIKIAPELRRKYVYDWILSVQSVKWNLLLNNLFLFSYKHAIDGVIRIAREEGIAMWMRGVTMTSTRGVMITSTQV